MPIVEAAGKMTGGASMGDPAPKPSVEAAMVAAIKKAQAEGITDPEIIRARIRDAIKEATGG